MAMGPASQSSESPIRRRSAGIEWMLSIAVVDSDDRDTIRLKRLIAGVLWFSLVTSGIGIAQFLLVGLPLAAATLATVMVTSITTLLVLAGRPGSFPSITHWIIGVTEN